MSCRWLLTDAEIARLGAVEPVAVVDERRVRRNIALLAGRARQAGVALRPHAKTHQTVQVADWCREAGARGLTVSSLAMAEAYAVAGWDDLTVALPATPRWAPRLDRLACRRRVGVLLEDPAVATALDGSLAATVRAWLKVDAGYGRVGVPWDDVTALERLAAAVAGSRRLEPAGVLTHAGQSYAAPDAETRRAACREAVDRLLAAREVVAARWGGRCLASFGDTPCCVDTAAWHGVDEIRPGNFVYFDLMQQAAGVCGETDIALAVACPVLAVQPRRGRLALHGGAVHLSAQGLEQAGRTVFGWLLGVTDDGFGPLHRSAVVVGISQEHGLLAAPPDLLAAARPGDAVLVAPVHSCLAADLARRVVTWTGDALARAGGNQG